MHIQSGGSTLKCSSDILKQMNYQHNLFYKGEVILYKGEVHVIENEIQMDYVLNLYSYHSNVYQQNLL
jgi:hypothetical protein